MFTRNAVQPSLAFYVPPSLLDQVESVIYPSISLNPYAVSRLFILSTQFAYKV
jgi:hypothetical protein